MVSETEFRLNLLLERIAVALEIVAESHLLQSHPLRKVGKVDADFDEAKTRF